MTNTMFKVTFSDYREVTVEPMPKGSQIRHVGHVRGDIVVWFEADLDLMDRKDAEDVEERRFAVVATGDPIPEGATYLGTVIPSTLVWHVFEVSP
jgi:hypothetical protein